MIRLLLSYFSDEKYYYLVLLIEITFYCSLLCVISLQNNVISWNIVSSTAFCKSNRRVSSESEMTSSSKSVGRSKKEEEREIVFSQKFDFGWNERDGPRVEKLWRQQEGMFLCGEPGGRSRRQLQTGWESGAEWDQRHRRHFRNDSPRWHFMNNPLLHFCSVTHSEGPRSHLVSPSRLR